MRTPHYDGDLIATHAIFGVYSNASNVTSTRSCGHILRWLYMRGSALRVLANLQHVPASRTSTDANLVPSARSPDTAELCHKGTITGHDLVPFRERVRDHFSTDAANRKRNGDRDGFGSTSPKAATCRSTPRKTSTGSPRNSTTDPAND